VEQLESEKIAEIYSRFSDGGDLAADFRARFGHELDEESLNENHQIVIVADALDDSTERIVDYLGDRGISINVLCFQVFIRPDCVTDVATVAELYARCHVEVRNRKADSNLLAPLGINRDRFISGDHGLPESIVADTVERMRDQAMDLRTQALIYGVDSTGPHVYHVLDPGQAMYVEKAGFQSIGIGSRLFDTVFMSEHYDSDWPLMRSLLLTFSAKRQAEMAPGVGQTTDVFIVRGSGWIKLSEQQFSLLDYCRGDLVSRAAELTNNVLDRLTKLLPTETLFASGQAIPDLPKSG
jgi:hypothetical protein